jgi:hypothetical protein
MVLMFPVCLPWIPVGTGHKDSMLMDSTKISHAISAKPLCTTHAAIQQMYQQEKHLVKAAGKQTKTAKVCQFKNYLGSVGHTAA